MAKQGSWEEKWREKEYDVTALGELLVDFTESGVSNQGNYLFEANPGGAPCNVLAMLAKLGKKTALIGKVGNDFLGRHLKEVVREAGIDTENLFLDRNIPTTLAFVHHSADGDRDFSFYRNPGADMCLCADEIGKNCKERIRASKIFHFGSLSLTHPGVRAATKKALEAAKEAGCLISFDPNLREPLWESLPQAKEQIASGMGWCDILKISDNEIRFFTGEQDFDRGVTMLKERYGIPLILLSMGREGSRAYCGKRCVKAAAYLQEKTVDTTGAGDTFCACVLNYVLEHGLLEFSEEELFGMLSFANAAASIVTTRKGALKVMPDQAQVEACLREMGRKE